MVLRSPSYFGPTCVHGLRISLVESTHDGMLPSHQTCIHVGDSPTVATVLCVQSTIYGMCHYNMASACCLYMASSCCLQLA